MEEPSQVYLAPKANRTDIAAGPHVDVFSLSATAYHLFAGRACPNPNASTRRCATGSTACFWIKQVCTNKGNGGIGGGIGDEGWEPRYEHDGTKLQQFPLARPYPTDLARRLDTLAQDLSACLPAAVLARGEPGTPKSEDP